MNRCTRSLLAVTAGFVALCAGLTSCGQDVRSRTEPSNSADEPGGLARFMSSDGYPNWASTNSHIVGFSSPDSEDPSKEPGYAVLDIDTHTISELEPPRSSSIVVPLGVGGLEASAVLVASQCDDAPDADAPVCEPGRLAIFTADVQSGSGWKQQTLPDPIAQVIARSVVSIQPGVGGLVVVVVTNDGRHVAFAVSDAGVRDLGLASPAGRQSCISQGDLFTLQLGSSEDPRGAVPVGLLRTSPGGATLDIDLPAVAREYGGISVKLLCTAESVFVTSSEPPPEGTTSAVWEMRGTGPWAQRPKAAPDQPSLAGQSISGDEAAAVVWNQVEGEGVLIGLSASTPTTPHVLSTAGVIGWRGTTGNILLLSGPDAERHEDASIVEVKP